MVKPDYQLGITMSMALSVLPTYQKLYICKNEGGYLKIGPSWDLFSKQNIFMTKRDMKNPKLGSCRGKLGLSFHDKSLVNTC